MITGPGAGVAQTAAGILNDIQHLAATWPRALGEVSMSRLVVFMAGSLLAAPSFASADVWDVAAQDDNTNATRNELVAGADQTHDLGVLAGPVADQDWYVVLQKPRSSYEIVVDSTSGDLGLAGPLVERLDSDGATVLQTSLLAGAGASRSLAWENATGAGVLGYLRVRSGACTTDCGPEDVYRIRLLETTGAIARFNNSASQVSVVILKSLASRDLGGHVDFWDATGVLRATQAFSLAPNGVFSVNTATLPALAGLSGSVTVSHDGRYGDVDGKAVAVEPATVFSFDTSLVLRQPPGAQAADGTKSFCNSLFGCPGAGQPFANVACAGGQCSFSCQGEHYDVNGSTADGCESPDSPQGNHTQNTATFLGSFDCNDASTISVNGRVVSDARVHELPPILGFDPGSGSAPDWLNVLATGGLCVNDISLTLQLTSPAFPTCYRMTVTTDQLTASCSTSAAGSCSIVQGSGSYSDDTNIYITMEKICGTGLAESADYNVSGHF